MPARQPQYRVPPPDPIGWGRVSDAVRAHWGGLAALLLMLGVVGFIGHDIATGRAYQRAVTHALGTTPPRWECEEGEIRVALPDATYGCVIGRPARRIPAE